MRRLDQVYHRAELRAAAYRGGEARKDLVGCGSRCGREHAGTSRDSLNLTLLRLFFLLKIEIIRGV